MGSGEVDADADNAIASTCVTSGACVDAQPSAEAITLVEVSVALV